MTAPLLTVEAVAERLSLPEPSVRRLIRRRELAAHDISTGARPLYRISEAQLAAYLAARRTDGGR